VNFERVWVLWFLFAVPIVLYVVWRARQSRTVPVTSLILWRRIEEKGRGRRFALENRLIFAFVAMSLMVFAGAGPRVAWRPEPRWVVALDASASMGTRTGGGTRLSRALRIASERLSGKLSLLVEPEGCFNEVTDFSLTPADLGKLPIRPTEAPGDTARLLRRARALAQGKASVVLLSDHEPEAGLGPAAGEADGAPLSLILVGDESHNVGITGFGVDGRRAFATVKNSCPEPVSAHVDAAGNSYPLSLEPGATRVLTLPATNSPVIIQIRAPGDDLEADNRVVALLEPRKVRVAFRGEPEPFLTKAFLAAGCDLSDAESADILVGSDGKDKHRLQVLLPNGAGWLGGGELRAAANGGLFKYVRLDGVSVKRLARANLPGKAEILARVGTQPAIARWRTPAGNILFLGFRLEESNWPLTPSFPIFWANVVSLVKGTAESEGRWELTGRRIQLDDVTKVVAPDRSVTVGRSFVPWLTGFHQAGRLTIPVNLLDERESDNRGSTKLAIAPSARHERSWSLDRLAAGAALVFLVLSLL